MLSPSFTSNLSKTRIFKDAMDDVKREADTLDSLTSNIKDIGSQVNPIAFHRAHVK